LRNDKLDENRRDPTRPVQLRENPAGRSQGHTLLRRLLGADGHYLKHQGTMRMGQLADLLVMDRATLGHNLRPLERDEGALRVIA
jgi:hypothetical protein